MSTLFNWLLFVSFATLVVGLIKPSLFAKVFKEKTGRKRIATVFGLSTFILLLAASVASPTSGTTPAPAQPSAPAQTEQPAATAPAASAAPQEDAATAKKDLTDLMALSEKANLVTSYELSTTQDTIYVGPVWYTQTVQFKKDFLGKVATLKEEAYGSHYFEVHDAYSNEKVAEVTAFSGSLEVYK